MVWESTRGKNMRPNRLSHIYIKSSTNTVLFVNTTIGFSENLFLVIIVAFLQNVCVYVCVCVCVCVLAR